MHMYYIKLLINLAMHKLYIDWDIKTSKQGIKILPNGQKNTINKCINFIIIEKTKT